MGWQDRQYDQGNGGGHIGGDGGGGLGSRMGGKSVVTWLLIINVVVFLIDQILTSGARVPRWMSPYFMGRFTVDEAVFGFQVWRVFTYQFLHADFMHILFNMIGLYFFGPLMEQWWGSRRFLAFNLLCGLGGLLPYTLFTFVAPGIVQPNLQPEFARYIGLVGASGAIYGVLIGCAVCFPKQEIRLIFPPIPMKMRTMAFVFLGLSLLSVFAGTPNAGGDLAHLGGALLGFVLIRTSRVLNFADRLNPQAIQDGVNKGRYERKVKREETGRAEIDRILAKVSEQGLHSLTKKEKKVLQQDTDRLRKN